MTPFEYRSGDLHCEGVRVADVIERFGTPALVYSTAGLRQNVSRFLRAFEGLPIAVRFSVKACPNVGVLRALAAEGAGLSVLSGGELERAWLSGVRMADVAYAGVAKSDDDLRAALDGVYSPLFPAGMTVDGKPTSYRGPVGLIGCESADEVERFVRVATGLRVSCKAAVRLSAEPEADEIDELGPPPATRQTSSKFGLPASAAREIFRLYGTEPNARFTGLHVHAGTCVHEPERLVYHARRLDRLARLIAQDGGEVATLNLGGGFAAIGLSSQTPTPEAYADALRPMIKDWAERGISVLLEPGRALVANAGVLVTRVLDVKTFEDRLHMICDAGLSASERPPITDGFRVVWPASVRQGHEPPAHDTERLDTAGMLWCDVAGPAGDDGDAPALGRLLPPLARGDLIAVFGAGAYALQTVRREPEGSPPAEILVDQYHARQTRARRTLLEMLGPETDSAFGL